MQAIKEIASSCIQRHNIQTGLDLRILVLRQHRSLEIPD
jgi:hypothetical protein